MRKTDLDVREVVCSETGKPMAKIPMWMADVKVKFISDEARQKHPAVPGLVDIEPIRRGAIGADNDPIKDLDAASVVNDDVDPEFEEIDADTEEAAEEDF